MALQELPPHVRNCVVIKERVHTRIQTMRTPSGVRFVFVYIFHAPRSCMIGQQGSFGRAEHAHVPLAKLCLSSCTVGNAREKGGLLFLFL